MRREKSYFGQTNVFEGEPRTDKFIKKLFCCEDYSKQKQWLEW